MNYKSQIEREVFEIELLRFIKSEIVGDGTVVTKNGRLWLRLTAQDVIAQFPNKKRYQVRYTLGILIDTGILLEDKVNISKLDQACWYALAEQPEDWV